MTQHVIKRTLERVDLNGKSANKLIKEIMQYGLAPGDFTGDFYSYLHHIRVKKYKSIGVRVLGDNILLYNKNSRRAITLYKIPEKYQPISQYIVSATKDNKKLHKLITEVKKLYKDKADIELQVLVSEPQEVSVGLVINNVFMCFGRGMSKFEAEINALELYLNKIYKNKRK